MTVTAGSGSFVLHLAVAFESSDLLIQHWQCPRHRWQALSHTQPHAPKCQGPHISPQ